MRGMTGASLGGGVVLSSRRRKAKAKAREREEKRWAKRSGPVVTYFDESVVRRDSDDVTASATPA